MFTDRSGDVLYFDNDPVAGEDGLHRGIRLEIEPSGADLLLLVAWRGDRLVDCKVGFVDSILDRARAWFGDAATGMARC